MPVRVRAPELAGSGGWSNTERPLRLADLRGRVVLLDFWTPGCVNCLHVLDELRPLEARFADVLTVVGVHSPKFLHERDPATLARALARHAVTHPVLDDPEMVTWDRYAVRAWPTLVVVDPDGREALRVAGEGHAVRIAETVAALAAEGGRTGRLRTGPTPGARPGAGVPADPPSPLRFPGRVAALPLRGRDGRWAERLVVADSGHHRLVVADPSGAVQAVIGTGVPGADDGPLHAARFRLPQGLAALDGSLLVADTGNHLVRRVDLAAGAVTTLAGTGAAGTRVTAWGPARATPLRSPWDLAPWDGRVAVALAGSHALGLLDPDAGTLAPLAGTGSENLVDGPAAEALFAQPSGLAAAGPALYVADAESSALRVLRDGRVTTLVGSGLFVWGDADGADGAAALQHPLGVAVDAGGALLVADTYNGAVRRWRDGALVTLARGLREPGGVAVDGRGPVLAADTGAHRVVEVRDGALHPLPLRGLAPPPPAPAGGVCAV
jgi:thiol-disulfide isomerase/thioredoxin